jgi:flagellar motor switch protein FliN/FliY
MGESDPPTTKEEKPEKGKGKKKSKGKGAESQEKPAEQLVDQAEIDALLGGPGATEGIVAPPGLPGASADLDQDAINDLLSGSKGAEAPDAPNRIPDEVGSGGGDGEEPPEVLSYQEKDAIGEIGNICMGAASTTLSMLLSQKVNITSPTVITTTVRALFTSFDAPYMAIYIKYIEGLPGFNLLIIRMDDAAVLADLMMGGDGTNPDENLTDIGVSAAAEAMNQMIGSSSTSMASMFGTTVNISPPETYVSHQVEEIGRLQELVSGYVVVASFNMIIGDILDTKIMQVLDIETAKKTAALILGDMLTEEGAEPVAETPPVETPPEAPVAAAPTPTPAPPAAAAAAVTPQQGGATKTMAAAPAQMRSSSVGNERLDMLLDIPLRATALLGRTKWSIKDILGIVPGSVVELDSMVDEPVEILVNGVLVAMGEVVVVNENFGVRITSIIDPEERLRRLMQRKSVP